VNPLQAYISKQQRAFEEPFPAIYGSAAICIKDEIASFLTSSLTGILEIIEQEINALYQTENSIVQLDELALMLHDVRNAAWRLHAPIHGF